MKKTLVQWRRMPLKEVLTYIDERVELDDMSEYITITVKRRHGGLQERERLFGHQIKTKKQFRLVPGAFIISRIQCWHQAYALVPEEIPPNMIASTNYDQFAISPEVDRRFFWWLSHLPFFTETIRNSASGVVIEKMVFNRDAWMEKTIPLPPLSEQQRIAFRIEEMMSRTKRVKTLREESLKDLEALRQSILDQIFGPKLKRVHDLRKMFFDGEFETVTLGEVCKTTSGGTPSRNRPEYFEGTIPWLKSGELNNSLITGSEEYITEEALENSSAKVFPKGTLLIALYGATVGKTGVLGIGSSTNQAICALFPQRNKLDRDYLHWFLKYKRNDFLKKSFGGAQPNISQRLLRKTNIPLPPLPNQHLVVLYLDSLQEKVDKIRKSLDETKKEMDELVPSILGKAFKRES